MAHGQWSRAGSITHDHQPSAISHFFKHVDTLSQYKILDRIGAGGIGDVYRARDTRLGRTVAIKVVAALIASDPSRRNALVGDANAAVALSHPNIAALYEIGEDQGELFLVFEFAPGETLAAAIAGRPLNARRAIDLAVQIADALADAHALGIVDGALAPDRIVITPKGSAKLLDVGLAAWTRAGAARAAAAVVGGVAPSSAAVSIVAYMSPEQVAGEPIDRRTDVFSLGVVLFEMLTGRPPFSGSTPGALAIQIQQAPRPALSAINRSLPAELEGIVSRALARRPEDRYQSIATLAAELRAVGATLDARSSSNELATVASTALAPRQRSFAGPTALAAFSIAAAAAIWWQYPALQRAWHRTMGPAPRAVIAVMPLGLAPADPARNFFADGLTEDLITRLAQTPGLTVIGRSGLRTYRSQSVRDVARQLGAAVLLSGTVRLDDDDVRMTLKLSNAIDGEPIWTGEYTRAAEDIVAAQAKAAEDVAQALHVPLRLTAATARTSARRVDRRAYEDYLRARQAAAERQPEAAARDYQDAISADDGLPEAFAGLARALSASAARTKAEAGPRRERMKTAAERAYDLDPDLADANVAMALASSSLSQTLQYLRRAIEIDPSSGDTYRDVADVVRAIDPELSAAFDQRARALDPQSSSGRTALSTWHSSIAAREDPATAAARDRDIARAALKGVLEKRP
jgi:eukaryotic-like serine/threonine-protein kinase